MRVAVIPSGNVAGILYPCRSKASGGRDGVRRAPMSTSGPITASRVGATFVVPSAMGSHGA